ncbi:type II toxin-antitoxin system Phd/YefM family antitoxin [Orrella sp. 11846]|uniref:type II toxin-antitoxin system Phd/YefM family antitoxin n=1 Tax=Orrella sp. 11846 TaxID=3409913 RepID=UPI003B5C3BC7
MATTKRNSRILDEMDETMCGLHRVGLISKRSGAAIISETDWDAIQETLYLASMPGMRDSIKKGMAEPLGSSAKELDW